MTEIEQLAINTIRTLSMDAVEAAKSGHPGTPMALAPAAYTLWNEQLKYNPADPLWPGRDRFVLSCGHASMLLYAMIHLSGVRCVGDDGEPTEELALPLEELRQFRQWASRTPGHPEHGHTFGVETTTGPLGQGCGNSVGMAIAQRWLSARFDRPGYALFDYNTYAFCSDGDLMEGVCCEAASLAGHLKLANLCWVYDDNRITIEGATDLAFSEDVAERFAGLGWLVLRVDDVNDLAALRAAYREFEANDAVPTLIIVRSQIAYGSPNKVDTHGAHGSPLGAEEVQLTKQAYGWPSDEPFHVPQEVLEHFQEGIGVRGAEDCAQWNQQLAAFAEEYPQAANEFSLMMSGQLPEEWDADVPRFETDAKGLATRVSAGKVLNGLAARVPWLLGGSADLAPSTMTTLTDPEAGHFSAECGAGRNLHFGIREHGMAAVCNGMALSGLRPFGATFFVFSDYLRPSMRLSSLMGLPVVYVFTHDSIGVGEDGPTHQPVEHLAACRAIPGLIVIRPGDANEAAVAWKTALTISDAPVALVLTRQNVPTLCRDTFADAAGAGRGAYVLADCDDHPQVILIASGSELQLCVAAHQRLTEQGIRARLVSFPSWELFQRQDPDYQQSVLPDHVEPRVVVEAGVRQGWEAYLGPRGVFIGIDGFGVSAPAQRVFEELGFTVDRIVEAAKLSI